jgi:hypothetical protein
MLEGYLAMMLFIVTIVAYFTIDKEETGYNDENFLD